MNLEQGYESTANRNHRSRPGGRDPGDVTNHQHPLFGRLRVEHWNNGFQQGKAAARAMLGGPRPYDYLHTFWSDQYEHMIEYVGFAKSWDRSSSAAAPRLASFSAST